MRTPGKIPGEKDPDENTETVAPGENNEAENPETTEKEQKAGNLEAGSEADDAEVKGNSAAGRRTGPPRSF